MHVMPGPIESLLVISVGFFCYFLPILFAVFVIVYLVKIRNTVEDIRKRVECLGDNKSAVT